MNCIIYIPGLGYDHFDISVEAYAQRYAVSLDRTHSNKLNQYFVETESISYGIQNEFDSKVASVYELGHNKEKRLVTKIFECPYQKELTQKFTQRNILVRSGLLFWALLKKIPFILFPPKSNQTQNYKKGRFQILYFSVVFLMVAIVGILMIPSTISLVIESLQMINYESIKGIIPFEDTVHNSAVCIIFIWKIISKIIVLFNTLILFLFPKILDYIESMAIEFLCLDYYLNYSDNHLDIMGKIEALYEKVAEQEKYKEIELHGFSFGSILMLDLLFPYSKTVNTRLKEETTNIVTIGCPIQFIERYYPRYFNGRQQTQFNNLNMWLNIHSKVDVMSSSIYNKKEVTFLSELPIEIENKSFDVINHENIGIWDYVLFIGIRAHTMYWGEDRNARNCLTLMHQTRIHAEENLKT